MDLVELLVDGEGNARFDVAVDVIFHPSTVNPPNWLQLENEGSESSILII